jgi:hypothetical protein
MASSAPPYGSCGGHFGQEGEIDVERKSWTHRNSLCPTPKGIYTPLSLLNPHHLQLHRLYYIFYYNALLHHLPRSRLCHCGLRRWLSRRGRLISYPRFDIQTHYTFTHTSVSQLTRRETSFGNPDLVTDQGNQYKLNFGSTDGHPNACPGHFICCEQPLVFAL